MRHTMTISEELAPLRGKRVVLADHRPHARGALREMVSLLGATTIVNAVNASDVLRQARSRSIDLIL
jgi:DNA-binding NarL/FixJ family response regulator